MRRTRPVILLTLSVLLCLTGCKRSTQAPSATPRQPDRSFQYVAGSPEETAGRWTVDLTGGGLLTVSHQAVGKVASHSSHFLSDEETGHVWKVIDQAKLDSPPSAEASPTAGAIQFVLEQSGRTSRVTRAPAAVSGSAGLSALQAELRRLVEQHAGQKLPL